VSAKKDAAGAQKDAAGAQNDPGAQRGRAATAARPAEGKAGAIADRGYTPYTGAHTPPRQRGRVVARHALQRTARQPWVIVTLTLALFPLLGVMGFMWLKGRVVGTAGLEATPLGRGSIDLLVYQFGTHWSTLLLAFFMALFAGGGAVADDARAGAFQFYFARPLTLDQYLWGKLVAVLTLVALVTLGSPALLALFRSSQVGSAGELVHTLPVLAAALALGAIEALALAAPAVALSSLARGRGVAQAGFAALFLLPWISGGILAGLTRSAWPTVLSLPEHVEVLGRALFGVPLEPDERALPTWVSALVVAALNAGSVALARRRLESVEVIAS
jgi:ABC-type transport system involved in multi-copper enzyme maturation permease subunit